MRLEVLKYLHDVVEPIEILERYAMGVTNVAALKAARLLNNGIQRRLAIIGEAFYKARNHDRTLSISNLAKIIGMRHILVYDYDKVREGNVIAVLKNHLSLLKTEVAQILVQHQPAPTGSLDD